MVLQSLFLAQYSILASMVQWCVPEGVFNMLDGFICFTEQMRFGKEGQNRRMEQLQQNVQEVIGHSLVASQKRCWTNSCLSCVISHTVPECYLYTCAGVGCRFFDQQQKWLMQRRCHACICTLMAMRAVFKLECSSEMNNTCCTCATCCVVTENLFLQC